MIFKGKRLFSFAATIMISIFAFGGINGCSDNDVKKIRISYVTDGTPCPDPSWTYTDIVKNYHCNAFDNYEGDINPIIPKGFEVAGLCTTVITNLTTPNVFEDVFKNNIIVDCSSGALTSFDFITTGLSNSLSPLRVNQVFSNVLKNSNLGDSISIKVTCNVQGHTRVSQKLDFAMPITGNNYGGRCISP